MCFFRKKDITKNINWNLISTREEAEAINSLNIADYFIYVNNNINNNQGVLSIEEYDRKKRQEKILEKLKQVSSNKDILERCKQALTNNDLKEIHEVALLYDEGIGVSKNQECAFELFLYAALLGYARSQNAVGICYEYGEGVRLDEKKAAFWYEKAVSKGHPGAMCNLGTMYARGQAGFSKNLAKGLSLIVESASKGNEVAENFLNRVLVGYRKFKNSYRGIDLHSVNACEIFSLLSKDALNGNIEAIRDLDYLENVQKY